MKKLWISLSIVFALLLLVGGYFILSSSRIVDVGIEDMSILVQKVSEEELSESILVTGTIVPKGEQKIFLDPERGEIIEYEVEENTIVEAGDTLFTYDSSKLDSEFNNAVRSRDLTKKMAEIEANQIEELTKQIADAKEKLETQKTKQKSDETEEIFEPFVTQEDINQLESEKVHLEISYEGTKAEITSLQEQINDIDKQRKEMTIVSDIDGTVVKVNKNIERTESGATEPVIHIISNEPFNVIGTMSEFDAVKIQPDQKVIIRPKVYKDREWNGVVESISPFPTDDGGDDYYYDGMGGGNVTMYPFTVAITDDTSDLRQGFHVSLEVNLGKSDKKLVIPHMAIMDDYEFGSAFVYVLVNGMLERRDIHTGEMSDEFIEITDGVALDELVVISPFEEMYDGMEVNSYDEVN